MAIAKTAERNSRIELLRLFGIYSIVLAHADVYGIRKLITPVAPAQMSAQAIIMFLLDYPGVIFTSLFIIITGYYCSASGVSYRRILLLLIRTCFFTWGCALVFHLAGQPSMPFTRALFFLFYGDYWFIGCYLVFSLFIPFINKWFAALSAKEHLRLIVILILLRIGTNVFGAQLYVSGAKDVELFFLLYAIGTYIRLHADAVPVRFKKRSFCFLAAAAVTTIYVISVICLCLLYRQTGSQPLSEHMSILLEPAHILTPALLFMGTINATPLKSSVINRLAAAVPGIYIIHEALLLRPLIWQKLFPVLSFYQTAYFLPAMLGTALLVMAACVVVDIPWTSFCQPLFMRAFDRIRDR